MHCKSTPNMSNVVQLEKVTSTLANFKLRLIIVCLSVRRFSHLLGKWKNGRLNCCVHWLNQINRRTHTHNMRVCFQLQNEQITDSFDEWKNKEKENSKNRNWEQIQYQNSNIKSSKQTKEIQNDNNSNNMLSCKCIVIDIWFGLWIKKKKTNSEMATTTTQHNETYMLFSFAHRHSQSYSVYVYIRCAYFRFVYFELFLSHTHIHRYVALYLCTADQVESSGCCFWHLTEIVFLHLSMC